MPRYALPKRKLLEREVLKKEANKNKAEALIKEEIANLEIEKEFTIEQWNIVINEFIVSRETTYRQYLLLCKEKEVKPKYRIRAITTLNAEMECLKSTALLNTECLSNTLNAEMDTSNTLNAEKTSEPIEIDKENKQ